MLYEDLDIIVIDKPAGLLTIANEKEKTRTAYHILTDYMRETVKNGRVFIVHRLDRDTSGVVLFAKNEAAKLAFQEDWESRVRRRGYRALVEGVPEESRGRMAPTCGRPAPIWSTPALRAGTPRRPSPATGSSAPGAAMPFWR